MLQLLGFIPTRSVRVNWALEEIGCEFENYRVDFAAGEWKSEKYLKINPCGKMPALVDDGVPVFESLAICTYLGDKFPESELVPKAGSIERAHYDQWMYFVGSELEQPLWTNGKHTFVFPPAKRVPEILDILQWEFDTACKVLSSGLGPNDFLVNNKLSMVDLCCAMTLRWAIKHKIEVGHDNLMSYLERMESRPSYKAIFDRPTKPFSEFDISVLK